jgi:hypothetical protein
MLKGAGRWVTGLDYAVVTLLRDSAESVHRVNKADESAFSTVPETFATASTTRSSTRRSDKTSAGFLVKKNRAGGDL